MRAPGLLSALLLTVALGVGSNAAVFGFLEGLTHPVSPVRGSGRVVSIFMHDRFREAGPLSFDEYRLLEASHGALEWVGAVRIEPLDATIAGGSEIATVAMVTPDLTGALTMPLANGAVISHRVWASELGGRREAIGSRVSIGNVDYRISGVAPELLEGLYSDQRVDVWVAVKEAELAGGARERRDLWVLAGLRSGVSLAQAQAALGPGSGGLNGLSMAPYTGIAPASTRGLTRIGMYLNFSAAAVLFIACINVATFLLGRALKRSQETSLRIALGATRAELMHELLADSLVISIAGGAVGLVLGILTAHALPVFLFEQDAQRLTFAPHLLPIVTAALGCAGITVLCGMMPVVGTVTDRPWTVLQRETGLPSKGIQRLRSGLVVGQIAACCVLVVGTALLVDSLQSALKTSAGHRLGDPILLTVEGPRPDGPEVDTNYFIDVEQKAKSMAGMTPLAWTARLPGSDPAWRNFRVQRLSPQYRDVAMDIGWLTPESLQLLDNEPVAGRMFGINDQRYRVAIVDEEAAARLFGKQTAGMVIRDSAGLPIEIIGVFKRRNDAKQQARATIYYGYVNQADAPRTIRDARFRIPVTPLQGNIELSANSVSAKYFSALDMQLIAGQMFRGGEARGQERVAVVNQEAADFYFNGKPLGAAVIDDGGVRTEIIGVVQSRVFGTFEQHAEPEIYFPMLQDCPAQMTLMLRGSNWNRGMAAKLKSAIESVPGPGRIAIDTLDGQLARSSLAGLRIATLIGSTSAVIGLVLGMLGLLSAQGDAERQRQRERAVRIALGAQRWRIVGLVVTNAGRLALMGTVVGTLISFVLLRFLVADIAAVASPPLRVWLIAPLLPAAVVLIASLIPARRSSVVSPSVIMRES